LPAERRQDARGLPRELPRDVQEIPRDQFSGGQAGALLLRQPCCVEGREGRQGPARRLVSFRRGLHGQARRREEPHQGRRRLLRARPDRRLHGDAARSRMGQRVSRDASQRELELRCVHERQGAASGREPGRVPRLPKAARKGEPPLHGEADRGGEVTREEGAPRETPAAEALGRATEKYREIAPPIHVSTTYERAADGSYPGGRIYSR